MSIPVFHDDQHGTAIISAAAMLNGLKVIGKAIWDIKVVCSGAGARGDLLSGPLVPARGESAKTSWSATPWESSTSVARPIWSQQGPLRPGNVCPYPG